MAMTMIGTRQFTLAVSASLFPLPILYSLFSILYSLFSIHSLPGMADYGVYGGDMEIWAFFGLKPRFFCSNNWPFLIKNCSF